MSHPKFRPVLVTVGALLFAALGTGLVVGIRDESGNVHSAVPSLVPASVTPQVGARTKAPTSGSSATGRAEPRSGAPTSESYNVPSTNHPPPPSPAATATKTPAAARPGNGGDGDTENHGGPHDGKGTTRTTESAPRLANTTSPGKEP